jgi:alkyl hydroperoxide reductase subunit AhpF
MPLLSLADQQKLKDSFAGMTRRVTLLFFTQTLDCEMCPQTRQILDELPPLSDRIAVEEVNLVLDPEKATPYGIDRAPAVAVLADGTDTRIRFIGAPAGYEFVSLVQAALLAGGGESMLTEENRQRLAAVDRPLTIQVFTTPS